MKILVAEDDAVSRRLIETVLAKWGYETVLASNGQEAWAILQQDGSPTLAILDWMMPEMDGVQVCRLVRKQADRPYVYVLLLTAKSRKQDVVEGMKAGADDYVTKPFDLEELRVRVRAGKRVLDLQSELMAAREALKEQATHDALTSLPNRMLFADRLTHRLARVRRDGTSLAVMFLDLDRFKLVNDTLGHSVGDLLLKKASERLASCLREVDTLARMGGDEFTILLDDAGAKEDVVVVAERILRELETPFRLGERDVFISTSIGISLFPSDGDTVESLVMKADTAMYRAKDRGRGTYHFYSDGMDMAVLEQVGMETHLRRALKNDEFVLHYQPRVDVMTGNIVGAEALIRWRHSRLGLLFPAQFIALAEETGLIVPIGEWVLATACAQSMKWRRDGFSQIAIAVNISPLQLHHGNIVESVEKTLAETGLDPANLELEITESAIIREHNRAIKSLNKLREMGVRISIDDFGTEYSSLSRLNKLPVDILKIDQSFVRQVTDDPEAAAVVGAIIAMAHALKLKVVAEGVETMGQLEFLRSMKCSEIQGYFVGRPGPADALGQMLAGDGQAEWFGPPKAA